LVPTVYVEDRLMEKHEKLTPNMIKKMYRVLPKARENLSRAFDSKDLKVAFGTDAGVYPHGENAHEFATIVKMGLPRLKAIQAATVNAADLIGWSKRPPSPRWANSGRMSPGPDRITCHRELDRNGGRSRLGGSTAPLVRSRLQNTDEHVIGEKRYIKGVVVS
jgi:Amidohydrolase family